MPREYPDSIGCPRCGEPCPRHCKSNPKCGWYPCLAEQVMHELGVFNQVTRKWKVKKTRAALLR